MPRLSKWFLVVLALALVVGLAAPALAAEAKGTIKSVSADKNEFVVTDKDGKDWTFEMDSTGKVQLNSKEMKLKDLKAGDIATITYDKVGAKLIAKELHCERK